MFIRSHPIVKGLVTVGIIAILLLIIPNQMQTWGQQIMYIVTLILNKIIYFLTNL